MLGRKKSWKKSGQIAGEALDANQTASPFQGRIPYDRHRVGWVCLKMLAKPLFTQWFC